MARINKYLGPTGLTELINLIQADFQKKQDWLQFPEMPDPALYTGKVVQYTGITDPLTFTKGFFYYSTGLEWAMVNTASAVEVVAQLPAWDDAVDGLIYYVSTESACYIKGSVAGQWFNIAGGDVYSFEIVAALPAWASANPKLIYMVPSDDGTTVTGYIRKDTANQWYQLGGGSVSGFKIVNSLPSWSTADENILYLVPDATTLVGYVKDVNTPNQFYQLCTESLEYVQVVQSRPLFASADAGVIYVVPDADTGITAYIKVNGHSDWDTFGGDVTEGISTADIDDIWEEVFG